MKRSALLLLGLGLVGSMAFAEDTKEELRALYKTEMEVYSIRAVGVKSVDVLVDYDQVEVDCHGLDEKYSVVVDKEGYQVIVTKSGLASVGMCPPFSGKHLEQGGVKFTLQPAEGTDWVTYKLITPAGAKVEVVKTKQ